VFHAGAVNYNVSLLVLTPMSGVRPMTQLLLWCQVSCFFILSTDGMLLLRHHHVYFVFDLMQAKIL